MNNPQRLVGIIFIAIWSLFFSATPNAHQWKPVHSRYVETQIPPCKNCNANAIAFDIDFKKGSGYGGIRKTWKLNLSGNFQFSFYIKSNLPVNNLEFKLIDSTGENVWWKVYRSFDFPNQWRKISIKKSEIEFAWGPINDKTLISCSAVEIIISSVNGGSGTVWIDQLQFQPLPNPPEKIPEPDVKADSEINAEHSASKIMDGNPETYWQSAPGKNHKITIDNGYWKELGALWIQWKEKGKPEKLDVWISPDSSQWHHITTINTPQTQFTAIPLMHENARYIKLNLTNKTDSLWSAIAECSVFDFDQIKNWFSLFKQKVKYYPVGFFPRYFYEQQNYWTITGAQNDDVEILVSEDGQIEVDKRQFSIEPFVKTNDTILTWHNGVTDQYLQHGFLPLPVVKNTWQNLTLFVTPFVRKIGRRRFTFIMYTLQNRSGQSQQGTFYVTFRPFQVNSPWQTLNTPGGLGKISEVWLRENGVIINKKYRLTPLEKPSLVGVSDFFSGEIIEWLGDDKFPVGKSIRDSLGFASGGFGYTFDLQPHAQNQYIFIVNYDTAGTPVHLTRNVIARTYTQLIREWEQKLSNVRFRLPQEGNRLLNIVRANLGYILVNMDGPKIQPGSRSYERSWIRDGSFTASALLRMGIPDEARRFVEWYSQFQSEDGYVPCVVDARGPDPVPEHDSHGELIYAIAEYYRFTHDSQFLENQWVHVLKAIRYLNYLSNQTRTSSYLHGDSLRQASYGLLPESISHEGYAAHPVHSYWDDFWGLKGIRDATYLARVMGYPRQEAEWEQFQKRFSEDIIRSIELTRKIHHIPFIPGSVELGDFDATSTAVAIYPVQAYSQLPAIPLQNTFKRYYQYFQQRELEQIAWDNYTPYEIRVINYYLLTGKTEKAWELLTFFLRDIRPEGWNHWAEVVRKNLRAPGFVGDMPHTWVGSEFVHVFRNMFAVEDPREQSLRLALGIKPAWLTNGPGIKVEGLPTYYGKLSYSIQRKNNELIIHVEGLPVQPKSGVRIWLQPVLNKLYLEKYDIGVFRDGYLILKALPARLKIPLK